MNNNEQEQLQILEKDLPYEDIILYRKLANASLLLEQKKDDEAKKSKSWFSGFFSTGNFEEIENSDEKIWKELYETIDYSEEKEILNVDETYPKDYVKMKFLLAVKHTLFELKDDK